MQTAGPMQLGIQPYPPGALPWPPAAQQYPARLADDPWDWGSSVSMCFTRGMEER